MHYDGRCRCLAPASIPTSLPGAGLWRAQAEAPRSLCRGAQGLPQPRWHTLARCAVSARPPPQRRLRLMFTGEPCGGRCPMGIRRLWLCTGAPRHHAFASRCSRWLSDADLDLGSIRKLRRTHWPLTGWARCAAMQVYAPSRPGRRPRSAGAMNPRSRSPLNRLDEADDAQRMMTRMVRV